ncbi:MAG: signal peptidase II [Pseudomonadota bacterium]
MIGTASGNSNARIGIPSRADYSFLTSVSGGVVALDYASKTWVTRHLPGLFDSVNPKGPLTLALEQNHAGAFGFMNGADPVLTRAVFSSISLVSAAVLIWLYLRLKARPSAVAWGLSLALGGALGNLLDRIRLGYVVDFVDLHVLFLGVQRRLSRFNLADVAITVGVGLLAAEVLRSRRAVAAPAPPA